MNHLYEGSLFESLWSSFYHGMEGLQCLKHPPHIPVGEVESGSFLETFVPQFMPQDSDTDQLLGHLWEERGEEKKVAGYQIFTQIRKHPCEINKVTTHCPHFEHGCWAMTLPGTSGHAQACQLVLCDYWDKGSDSTPIVKYWAFNAQNLRL